MAAATTSPRPTRKVRRARAALAIEVPTGVGQLSTAASRKIKDQEPRRMERQKWQEEAYGHVDFIGEVGYVVGQISDVVARADIKIVERDLDTGDLVIPDKDEEGNDIIDGDRAVAEKALLALRGPGGDHKSIVRAIAEADFIAGEGHLVGTPLDNKNQIAWEFLSIMEIVEDRTTGKKSRKRHATHADRTGSGGGSSQGGEELDGDTYVSRYHRRDPRHSGDATSSLRRVAAACREVVLLTQLIEATIKSHIPAGILLVADELSLPQGAEDETVDDDEEIDPLLEVLTEHLSAPIEDRQSAASLVPLLLNAPAEVLDKALKLVKLDAERMDPERIINLRENSLGRIATGVDVPPETMTGMGSLNHWCLDDQTEAYTRDGWKPHTALSVGDEVWTLDHATGQGEWAPIEDFYRADVVDEPMIAMANKSHSSVSTPNHRWPTLTQMGTRKWATTEEAPRHDRIMLGAPVSDRVQKYDDDLVRLLAWYSAEGTVTRRTLADGTVKPNQIRIGQSHVVNPEDTAEIRRVLTSVFGPGYQAGSPVSELSWTESVEEHRGMTLFVLNAPARDRVLDLVPGFDKIVPAELIDELTASQAELFVRAFMRADGQARDQVISQTVPGRLDAVERACTRAGIGFRRWVRVRGSEDGFSDADQHHLSLRRSAYTAPFTTREEVSYTGVLWCPVTRNRSWFARRDGYSYFTGNTGATVSKDFIEKHVIPAGDRIVQFLTIAYLRRILVDAEQWDEARAERFEFEFDAASLLSRADAAASADTLWRDRVLSDDARLRAHGFDPDKDKPKDEERFRRYVEAIALAASVTNKPFLAALGLDKDTLVEMGMDPDAADALLSPAPPPAENVDAPDEDPPEAGEPGADEDVDAQEGQTPGGSEVPVTTGPEELARIEERIRVAASERLRTTIERAAGLAIQRIPRDSLDTKDRVRALNKLEVLPAIPASDWRKMATDPAKLIQRPWVQFQGLAVSWLRTHFEQSGRMAHYDADETAHRIASEIVAKLDELYLAAYQRPLRQVGDGLFFPGGVVEEAVARHLELVLQ